MSLRTIISVLGIVCATVFAQKPAYGPPTPSGYVEKPLVVHVLGDGVNYYKIIGGPQPKPPPPMSSIAEWSISARAFLEAGKAKSPSSSSEPKPVAAPPSSSSLDGMLKEQEKYRADARQRADAMVRQGEASVAAWAIGWCREQGRKFHPIQEKARAVQRAASEKSQSMMSKQLDEALDVVRDEAFEPHIGSNEKPEEKSKTKYKRTYQDPYARFTHVADALRTPSVLNDVVSAHPINVQGAYTANEITDAWTLAREVREAMAELAMDGLDLALGVMPVVGPTRAGVEAVTGVNLITGEELSTFERGMAVAIVATAGTLSAVKEAGYAFKNLPEIPKVVEAGAAARVGAIKDALMLQSSREALKTFPESIQAAERMLLRLNDVQYFGPMLEGPLPKPIADSFRSSTYFQGVLKEDRLLYRVASSQETLMGRFLTADKPLGRLQVTLDSAIIPEFDNKAKLMGTFRIPKGTMIYEGIIGPQTSATTGVFRIGGGSQIFLDLSPSQLHKFLIKTETLP